MKDPLHALSKHNYVGLFVLRLVVGILFLVHGTAKWKLWGAPPGEGTTESMLALMKFLSIVEPLGGLALVMGFLTRYAALGLGIIMLGAIYFKLYVWNVGFIGTTGTGAEFDLVLLAAAVMLFFAGAGKWSLDHTCCKGE